MNPLLLPVLAYQGLRVRAATEVLPPADGPTSGEAPAAGAGAGDAGGDEGGPAPFRLAVVGESTAAGCGVATHAEGFAGCLARELAGRTGRPVSWEVVGRHGATIRRVRHRLLPELRGTDLDLAVLLAGVNDVLARRSPTEWGEELAATIDELADRAARVVVPGIPPFRAFPSLPTTLGRYLAKRAGALDATSRRVCAARPAAAWLDSTGLAPVGPDFFSRDRFHPSAAGYRRWAGAVAAGLPD
ncbi:SGNH/GDSL hydrolase family protein [Streptomyces sp. DSM 44915]|uniref:SGNH/GDSL hydrolase family protein n=1 Tax=Streptomyces chisholmiae TaxID=3075540 RepID=A0ABU2JPB2_9ACTN|nr:SGNH/GDSL hydrolase family protein [Streptomyces sp. DSM 44915]MDT0266832.1 SGNH/GDSL hydrolase family protein [Streptomyces sp. DSM 44915]